MEASEATTSGFAVLKAFEALKEEATGRDSVHAHTGKQQLPQKHAQLWYMEEGRGMGVTQHASHEPHSAAASSPSVHMSSGSPHLCGACNRGAIGIVVSCSICNSNWHQLCIQRNCPEMLETKTFTCPPCQQMLQNRSYPNPITTSIPLTNAPQETNEHALETTENAD